MAVILTSIICGFCIVAMVISIHRRARSSLLTPLGIYSAVFILDYIATPILQELTGKARFEYFFSDNSADIYVIFAILIAFSYFTVSILGFLASRPLLNPGTRLRYVGQLASRDENLLITILIVIFATSIFTVSGVLMEGIHHGYAYFIYNRIDAMAGQGYAYKLLLVYIPLGILLFLRGRTVRKGRNFYKLAAFSVVGVGMIGFLLLGARKNAFIGMLYIVIAILMLRGVRLRLRPLLKVLAVALGLLVVVGVAGSVRSGLVNSGHVGYLSGGIDNVSVTDSLATTTVESFDHVELLAYLIQHNQQWKFGLGKTYAAAITLPIPRSLWPSKPVGAGPMLVNIVHPGSYKVGQEGSTSYTTGTVLEAYMNWGLLGVLVMAFIHGMLIGKLHRYAAKLRNRREYVFYVLTAMFLCVMVVYGEFLNSIGRYGIMILPVLFSPWLYRVLLKRPHAMPRLASSMSPKMRTRK